MTQKTRTEVVRWLLSLHPLWSLVVGVFLGAAVGYHNGGHLSKEYLGLFVGSITASGALLGILLGGHYQRERMQIEIRESRDREERERQEARRQRLEEHAASRAEREFDKQSEVFMEVVDGLRSVSGKASQLFAPKIEANVAYKDFEECFAAIPKARLFASGELLELLVSIETQRLKFLLDANENVYRIRTLEAQYQSAKTALEKSKDLEHLHLVKSAQEHVVAACNTARNDSKEILLSLIKCCGLAIDAMRIALEESRPRVFSPSNALISSETALRTD